MSGPARYQAQQAQIDPALGTSFAQHPLSAQLARQQFGDLQKANAPTRASHARGPADTTTTGLRGELPASQQQLYTQPSPTRQPYYYQTPPQPYHQQVQTPLSNAQPNSLAESSPNPASASLSAHGSQAYGSPVQGGQDGGEDASGADSKRPRACDACRGLKVRCDQDPAHPETPCKRCAKAGRPCIITQPSRKRQKKADSRVSELEKKLDALTAALHSQQGGPPAATMQPQVPEAWTDTQAANQGTLAKRRRTEETAGENGRSESVGAVAAKSPPQQTAQQEEQPSNRFAHVPHNDMHQAWSRNMDLKNYLHGTSPQEFVARINGLIPPDVATRIFTRYNEELAPCLPAVVFPPGTTADQVFREKPILYIAILCASAFNVLPREKTNALAQEVTGAIADCVVRNGAKSLELVQAIQVTALWYRPPEQPEKTNFYQLIHMAAVMALDIGLGRPFNQAKARRAFCGGQASFGKTQPLDSDTVEARRAWLCCYYLCASASNIMRRPNLVRWTNYMRECIEVLETSPDGLESDKLFCQHVKIQHICEDIGLQFLMDDNTAQISITDPKVTYALTVLENHLKDWRNKLPLCLGRSPFLRFFEHVTSLYLHEIALHFNHNIEDFRVPFTEESLKNVSQTGETLTQNQMAALEACLTAAHGVLDTMLNFEQDILKSLPMLLYFVRCVYSIVILIKMHVAVCTPNSELGKMMRPEDIKVEFYIDRLFNMFSYVIKETSTGTGSDGRPKVVRILALLKEWFLKHKQGVALTGKTTPVRSEQGETDQHPREQQRQEHNQRLPDGRHRDSTDKQQKGGLELLSRVATGEDQQQQQSWNQQRSGSAEDLNNFTFNHPGPVAYAAPNRDNGPGPSRFDPKFSAQANGFPSAPTNNSMPAASQQQSISNALGYTAMGDPGANANWPGGDGMMDPTNNIDYGWGNGFEQAMDIALGDMDGLSGSGLDGWFLGDNMAPYAFDNSTQLPGVSATGDNVQW